MPDRDTAPPGLRPFWSGALTFGLVNVPVLLYAGTRSEGGSLRMVSEDGSPLEARYFCPVEDREVDRDELVRGYEVDDGRFVVITEEELDALAPEKSREIDLRRFVPVDDLDPAFFDRPYVLVPGGGSNKAYRLLAEVMERTGRAGVATFVMRTKEYLVAILARDGILRAETLRFNAEIRSPADVGLEAPATVKGKTVKALAAAIRDARESELDPTELEDPRPDALKALVAEKRKEGRDVVEVRADSGGATAEAGARVIDLMEVLRRSLAADEAAGAADDDDALAERTKDELYERARELDLPGRSSMSKAELIEALEAAG